MKIRKILGIILMLVGSIMLYSLLYKVEPDIANSVLCFVLLLGGYIVWYD